RGQRSDRRHRKLKRPPVIDLPGGLLPHVSRLHPFHQALERAEFPQVRGHSVSLKIGGTRSWNIKVCLLQAPRVERAGADYYLYDVLDLDNAPLPKQVWDGDGDRIAVVCEGLLTLIQFLATDVS